MVYFCFYLEMEKKVKEERAAREKAENRIVQIEKQCSMLDFDLKQSQQKLEHLNEQKERLEEEVRRAIAYLFGMELFITLSGSIRTKLPFWMKWIIWIPFQSGCSLGFNAEIA